MQLPVPCFYKEDKIYDRVEYKKPKTGIIANAYEVYQSQGNYPAMLEFVTGTVKSYTSMDDEIIEDKTMIRAITRRLPFMSAEAIALKVLAMVNEDDWVEGVYGCPRCGKKIITGVESDLGLDNRDRISELEIKCMGQKDDGSIDIDHYNNDIFVELEEPVIIKHAKTGNVLHEINTIEITYPTVDNCIKGSLKYGDNKDVRREMAIYASCLKKVNGQEIDVKFRKTWAEFIFTNIEASDMNIITKAMKKYGIKKTILRTCISCGKRWESPVNTSNFFVSGLQQM